MTIKATHFRQNLFQILDQCRASGEKVTIERGGEVYELIPKRRKLSIEELPENPGVIDPETVHLVQAWDWKPDDLS